MSYERRFSRIAALRVWFGLHTISAAVLLSLYEAKGKPMNVKALAEHAGVSPTLIRVRICQLRVSMECEAVDTTPAGYALTDIGLADVKHALSAMALDLMEFAA